MLVEEKKGNKDLICILNFGKDVTEFILIASFYYYSCVNHNLKID